jgi:hypothetical protein
LNFNALVGVVTNKGVEILRVKGISGNKPRRKVIPSLSRDLTPLKFAISPSQTMYDRNMQAVYE